MASKRAVLFAQRSIASIGLLPIMRTCDVLLPMSHFFVDVFPALLSGRCSVAYAWHLQDSPWDRPGNLLNNTLAFVNERLGLALIRGFIPVLIAGSTLARRRFDPTGQKKTFVTTNGVSPLAFGTSSTFEQRSDVAYIGRLHPSKGLEDLIDAWSIAHPAVPSHRLFIAGGGADAYTKALIKRASTARAARSIYFLGAIPEEQKYRLLQRSRAFAFASKEEGWGIAIAEAMASGLPCITYDLEIFREVFPFGRIAVASGDIVGFAAALERLLTNSHLWESLAHNARSFAGGFSWDQAAATEEQALRAGASFSAGKATH